MGWIESRTIELERKNEEMDLIMMGIEDDLQLLLNRIIHQLKMHPHKVDLTILLG